MKITLIALVLFCSIVSFAQDTVYEPRILILSPGKVSFDPSFQADLDKVQNAIRKIDLSFELSPERAKNVQLIGQSAADFTQHTNAFGVIPIGVSQNLCFKLRGLPQLLVVLDTASTFLSREQLRELADQRNVQHIIFFPELKLYRKRKTGYTSLTVKVYDRTMDAFVLDKTYTENWLPEKGEQTEHCDEKTVGCLMANVTLAARHDVLNAIVSYNPMIQQMIVESQERQQEAAAEQAKMANAEIYVDSLKREKFDLLKNDYFLRPFDRNFLQKVIPASDHSIRLAANYQLLFNADSTKFVAFFLDSIRPEDERLTINDARAIYDNIALELNVEPSEDEENPKFMKAVEKEFNRDPNMRGYLVRGVIYYGEWYYDKLELSDYAMDDLQKTQQIFFTSLYNWHFFRKTSTELNPKFWLSENEKGDTLSPEDYLFARVRDLDNNANYQFFGERSWNKHEPENESFVGLYEVVANHIVRETEQFDPLISETILFPAYRKMTQANPTEFKQFGRDKEELYLLYPNSRNMILNPVVVTNAAGEKHLRYFVVIPGTKEVFEWTYFPPTVPKDAFWFKDTVKEQLKALTDPGSGIFFGIDDRHFWEEYVFKKSGDKYQYLKAVGR